LRGAFAGRLLNRGGQHLCLKSHGACPKKEWREYQLKNALPFHACRSSSKEAPVARIPLHRFFASLAYRTSKQCFTVAVAPFLHPPDCPFQIEIARHCSMARCHA
jgi:hypothetical protein